MTRNLLFVVNPSREIAALAASELAKTLTEAGFTLFTISDVELANVTRLVDGLDFPDFELVLVLGGDGTILRGAQVARAQDIPLLGVNLGHVGFMAEVEKPVISEVARCVIEKSYVIDPRMVLAYSIEREGAIIEKGWALNEVSIERNGTTMVELFLEIDNRPISRWGCDGLICSTPTGSTAYAFSAGGPVLWPEVEAIVLLPIAAHALFSRPLVVSPRSEISVGIESSDAVLSADAIRKFALKDGDRVHMVKDSSIIKLAHTKSTLFSDRLVAKFKLPIEGWRGE